MANLFNKIYTGTLAQYTSASKEANSLYMIKDSETGVFSMYKGTTKVAGSFIIVNGAAPTEPEKGQIYYISAFLKEGATVGTPFVGFWDGGKWVSMTETGEIGELGARLTVVENAIKIDGTATANSIGAKVAQLDGADTVDGSVKKQIKDAIEALDVTETTASADGAKVTVKYSETDGKVSMTVTENDIASAAGLTAEIERATAAEEANADAIAQEIADRKAAINALDYTDTETAGSVVVAVSEADGVISTTKQAVTVFKLDTPSEGNSAEYQIKIGDTAIAQNIAIPYAESVLTNAVLSDMNATVNESTGAVTPGDPKGDDALVMVFKKADGKFVGVKVNISSILTETEFKDGLKVVNHEVSIKLESENDYLKFTSDTDLSANKFLSANVVALNDATDTNTGLADALDVKTVIEDNEAVTAAALDDINERIEAMDATPSSTSASGHVTVALVEEDGIITSLTVSDSDIASAADLATLDNTAVKSVNGKTGNTVTVGGADIALTGYSKGTDASAVVATDTVNAAIGKLENQIDAAVAGGLQAVEAGDGIEVTAVADNKQTISAKVDTTATEGVSLSNGTSGIKVNVAAGAVAANNDNLVNGGQVFTAITNAVESLDSDATSTDGTNVQVKVTEVDGKITAVNITTDNTVNATDVANEIANLDATVGSTTVDSGKHVAVQVVETDGKLTGLTVTEDDIASAALLGTATDTSSEATAFGKIKKNAEDIAAETNRATGVEGTLTNLTTTDKTDLVSAINEVNANAVMWYELS